MGLPRSGLEDLTYPNLFPQPPATLSSIPANENPSGDSPDVDGQQAVDEQRSWFFYTVEISMRRTIHDTLWILYRKGEQYWMDHIDALLRQYTESEKDISLWYKDLELYACSLITLKANSEQVLAPPTVDTFR